MVDKEIIQIKTRELYHLLLVKDVDILLAHKLLSQISNVILYRNRIQTAVTPEGEALARWDVESARVELESTLYSMNICDLDKVLVRYIANNFQFDKE